MASKSAQAPLETPCDPAVAFRLADGRAAHTLRELADALESSPWLAEHHRFHLQPWVRDIRREPHLAEELHHLAQGTPGDAFRLEAVRAMRNRLAEASLVVAGGVKAAAARAR